MVPHDRPMRHVKGGLFASPLDFGTALLVAAVSPEQVVLIAEMSLDQEQRIRLGLVSVRDDANRFTGERQGHIQVLAVTAKAEGQGVGRVLLPAAIEGARPRAHASAAGSIGRRR
jgi:GNAT superfamily N-acetyltransferase